VLDTHTSCRQRGQWKVFQRLNACRWTRRLRRCALFALGTAKRLERQRRPCFGREQQSPWLHDALLSPFAGMIGTLRDIRFWLYPPHPQRLCAPATVRVIVGRAHRRLVASAIMLSCLFANAGSRYACDLCALRKIAGQQHAGPIRGALHSFLLLNSSPKHGASPAASTTNRWREDTAVWY
jgi:hypothetical protein